MPQMWAQGRRPSLALVVSLAAVFCPAANPALVRAQQTRSASPKAQPAPAATAQPGQPAQQPAQQPTSPQANASAPAAGQPAAGGDVAARDDAAEGAIRFLEARVKEFPNDPAVPVRLAAALLERAKRTADYALFARAEDACKEALKRDAKHAPAMVVLGSIYLAQHRFAEALEAAEKALKVRADMQEALALRGDAQLQLGNHQRARADYEKLLAANPDLLAHARMSSLQFAEADAPAAVAGLEAALKAGEEKAAPPALMAWGLVRLGELRFRTGEWEEADRWYKRALELNGDDPDALDHMAELHAARGEHEPALELLDKALALSPRPEFHHNRGDVLLAKGDLQQAFDAHERALAGYLEAAQAGHAHYYHHLAGFYSDVDAFRDPREAQRWARGDLQLRRTVATFDALAWALYHDGKYAEAAAMMDKGLRQRTADAHVLYHAGLIYARAGDEMKGRLHLRRAATANPKFNEFHFHR